MFLQGSVCSPQRLSERRAYMQKKKKCRHANKTHTHASPGSPFEAVCWLSHTILSNIGTHQSSCGLDCRKNRHGMQRDRVQLLSQPRGATHTHTHNTAQHNTITHTCLLCLNNGAYLLLRSHYKILSIHWSDRTNLLRSITESALCSILKKA